MNRTTLVTVAVLVLGIAGMIACRPQPEVPAAAPPAAAAAPPVAAAAVVPVPALPPVPPPHPASLQTPLTAALLDRAAYAEWVDGAERALPVAPGQKSADPGWILWTQTTQPGWSGQGFGDSKQPGPRHLRVGFTAPVTVGTVLAMSGARLSVLRAGAAYPGDLADDGQWEPARRQPGEAAGDGVQPYLTWVLPPGTATRALRFTHTAQPADTRYAGQVQGAYVLAGRFDNLAPAGQASASVNPEAAAKVVNRSNDRGWQGWSNGDKGGAEPISRSNPLRVLVAWPEARHICGINALQAVFARADIQVYTGPADRHPREAPESDWRTVVADAAFDYQYPRPFGVNLQRFPETVLTRAVRLSITAPFVDEKCHPHVIGCTNGGRKASLGELQILGALGDAPLAAPERTLAEAPHPPIPVRFTLAEAGTVTLVIEDAAGQRVRNLVSETPFPAGGNVVWWDGLDDRGRDGEAAGHGVYHVPGSVVAPGTYTVRGLVRGQIDLRYEFSIYSNGSPVWETADGTGWWLGNHTPPSAAAFVPAADSPFGQPTILIGSHITEGGSGLAWLDLTGRKLYGVGWLGGNWTGAQTLCVDGGARPSPAYYAYAASAFEGNLRLTGLRRSTPEERRHRRAGDRLLHGEDKLIIQWAIPAAKPSPALATSPQAGVLAAIAARDGVVVCSLPALPALLLVDAAAGSVVGRVELADPRGVAFDAQGRLLALSGTTLLRGELPAAPVGPEARRTIAWQTVVAAGLEDPRHLALAASGDIFISDLGESHQVKVFTAAGAAVRCIGRPGAPRAGAYNRGKMQNPCGLAITGEGGEPRLWVAERDEQPKRISAWTLDGRLERDLYGPGPYGGGGTLDPRDPTRFYFGGMEFALDWKAGTSRIVSVFHRPAADPARLDAVDSPGPHAINSGQPETPIYANGAQYLTNTFNNHPTNGSALTGIWQLRGARAVLVAAAGNVSAWNGLLSRLEQQPALRERLPAGTDLKNVKKLPLLFVWSDVDGDGDIQPGEITFAKIGVGGLCVMPDLTLLTGTTAVALHPTGFASGGAPLYDLARAETLVPGGRLPNTSGGGMALLGGDGWTVLTVPPEPFPAQTSLCGARGGKVRWTYPNMWPGLHPSHHAPAPQFPGMLVGTTRLLGPLIKPRDSDIGELWAVNGNHGCIYLFSTDGLYVATLFKNQREGRTWTMPTAVRGMLLNEVTLSEECFWPTMTQTTTGEVFIQDGYRQSLVRVDGLSAIRRLQAPAITVDARQLAEAQAWFVQAEVERQRAQGAVALAVDLAPAAPLVDGRLDDWKGAEWATIDVRRRQTGDWSSVEERITGAVRISGDRLYVAWRTADAHLLKNSAATWQTLFKSGGCLDLMIGADPKADAKRSQPAAGDCRLLVSMSGGKLIAVLYRPVVPGTPAEARFPFTSPVATVHMDKVELVSEQVVLAGAAGDYELSVPLQLLGLAPAAGGAIRADIGILRGNGFQTLQRCYWSNKATGITADVPSEARLSPALWGTWRFRPAAP
ncbi:MAG: hypothetical protein L6R48_05645 [Planctomycetes bacterium]|nr:hypothetical protein [Planctomycetota bacterium]